MRREINASNGGDFCGSVTTTEELHQIVSELPGLSSLGELRSWKNPKKRFHGM